jgi:hypothetical protein
MRLAIRYHSQVTQSATASVYMALIISMRLLQHTVLTNYYVGLPRRLSIFEPHAYCNERPHPRRIGVVCQAEWEPSEAHRRAMVA